MVHGPQRIQPTLKALSSIFFLQFPWLLPSNPEKLQHEISFSDARQTTSILMLHMRRKLHPSRKSEDPLPAKPSRGGAQDEAKNDTRLPHKRTIQQANANFQSFTQC